MDNDKIIWTGWNTPAYIISTSPPLPPDSNAIVGGGGVVIAFIYTLSLVVVVVHQYTEYSSYLTRVHNRINNI